MTIRPATAADAEAIARVHVASWQTAYRDLLPADYLATLSIDRRRVMWAESIGKGRPQILVVDIEGEVLGFSAFGPSRDHGASPTDFEIWAIYLAPSHWSRGHGRELWLATQQAMLELGARHISLWVIANNRRAIAFYQAAGFTAEVNLLKKFEIGGVELEEVRYVQTVRH